MGRMRKQVRRLDEQGERGDDGDRDWML